MNTKTRFLRSFLVGLSLTGILALPLTISGCDSDDGPIEEIGEEIDDAADDVGDAVEDAVDGKEDQ